MYPECTVKVYITEPDVDYIPKFSVIAILNIYIMTPNNNIFTCLF